jgi:DNA-binding Xre family transcriptional regulator
LTIKKTSDTIKVRKCKNARGGDSVINTNLLKAKITEKGLNQTKLANILGLSAKGLSEKITNKRKFTADEAGLICDILDIENAKPYFFIPNVHKCT